MRNIEYDQGGQGGQGDVFRFWRRKKLCDALFCPQILPSCLLVIFSHGDPENTALTALVALWFSLE